MWFVRLLEVGLIALALVFAVSSAIDGVRRASWRALATSLLFFVIAVPFGIELLTQSWSPWYSLFVAIPSLMLWAMREKPAKNRSE